MKCLVCSLEGKNLCERCEKAEIRYGHFVIKQGIDIVSKVLFGVVSETDLDSKWMNIANEYPNCEVDIEIEII